MCPECGNFDIAENPDPTGLAWWCRGRARFNGPAEALTLSLCCVCGTGVHLATAGHSIVTPARAIFCDECWTALAEQTAADRRGE